MSSFRNLEINGGRVENHAPGHYNLFLPSVTKGYADAQIDDYGRLKRANYPWLLGTRLQLEARFSHPESELIGTAGFGFWNAPFGDPTIPWPTLPQAAWFFYGSSPTNLPLALEGAGRGWFASTINARSRKALALIPTAPLVLLLNQFPPLRQRIWPAVRQRLGITYEPLKLDITEWHTYRLDWQETGCTFVVDGRPILQTFAAPTGPLGFVCWLDNQYLALTVRGRFGWGTIPIPETQTLSIRDLQIQQISSTKA
ncbi:MAG: hypothetical protein WAM60_25895 [Candidatus Promineifilaceae bacterium]